MTPIPRGKFLVFRKAPSLNKNAARANFEPVLKSLAGRAILYGGPPSGVDAVSLQPSATAWQGRRTNVKTRSLPRLREP
jgi:hypothetical protein